MKKSLSLVLAISMVVAMLVPTSAMAAASNGGLNYSATKKVATEKASLLTDTFGTTSVQYALIDHGNIVVSGQAGKNDAQGKVPLSKNTMYGIGSTSKVFTTVAVMKLVEEGKVDLDTPVVQYIPEFTMKDERYKKITPRMLLNHSSGLRGSTLGNSFLLGDNDTINHDTMLEQLKKQTLKADPGAFSVYCNDGFTLAEILVERVSGMGFTKFLHQYITEPAAMSHTKTPLDNADKTKFAGTYHPAYEGQLPTENGNVIGAGGIYSTAEDLVRFAQIFTGENDKILSSTSVKAMRQEEYKRGFWPEGEVDTVVNYGLGWDSVKLYPFNRYGIQAENKGGDTIMYHASLVVLPEHNMAAAVLSSGGSSSTNAMLANEMVLQALKEKGTIKELQPAKSFGKPKKAAMPADVAKYAGYYASTNVVMKVAIAKNGELSITYNQAPDMPAAKYVYTADGTFMNEEGTTKIRFDAKDNGRTYLWQSMYLDVPGLSQLALTQYTGEKLEKNDISKEVESAWTKRIGKKYFPVNEKYSSLTYLLMDGGKINKHADLPGYVDDKTITGPDSASNQVQIPAMGGRDTMEYQFFTKDGVEYLDSSGYIMVSEDTIKPLYQGSKSTVTIQEDGYAKWFKLPKAVAGKKLTVTTMPKQSSFAVYNEQGHVVHFSLSSTGKQGIELPSGGTIVFAGGAGAKFEVSIK
ncbi:MULTISPECIES: serine hydrolase domain-containing protein [Paenibacillus]|uniref:Beta-lactamase family protein n=1 Tax=Paenibacillus alvei TaxID=44250 RepID=A0ABT4EE25_PAEAL|nr:MULTISPECIES: serine hydrolase domain-containing protein [Paenibacillus]MCY9531880.1 beta-lactamase family protein [Paenibacillus alvei]